MSLHGLPLPCGWWLFTGLGATVNNLRVAVTQVTFMTRAVKKVFKKKIIKKHIGLTQRRSSCSLFYAWFVNDCEIAPTRTRNNAHVRALPDLGEVCIVDVSFKNKTRVY